MVVRNASNCHNSIVHTQFDRSRVLNSCVVLNSYSRSLAVFTSKPQMQFTRISRRKMGTGRGRCEGTEPSKVTGGNIKWGHHFKNLGSLQKVESPCNAETPFLGPCPIEVS